MTDLSKIAKMFKAYDLRGTVPSLTAEVYYFAGIGFVEKILKPQNLPLEVNVCHDCRYSSPEFFTALCQGLVDGGAKVNALGMLSTDLMYAASLLNNKASMIVTASHNPKDDNGLKVVKTGSEMLGLENGLDIVRDFVLENLEEDKKVEISTDYPETNEVLRKQIFDLYLTKVKQIGKIEELNTLLKSQNRKLKVVVDCGNGMGGVIMNLVQNLFAEVELVPMYWEPDGNFPNHPADPSHKENLVELQAKIRETKADLGVATDGDADRCYFLDEKGEIINGSFFGAVMSQFMLQVYDETGEKERNRAVVYNFPTSRCIPNTILENGGIAIPSPMGHTFIKKYMEKYQAWYGLEHSMHHYYGAFGNFENSGITMSLMFYILASTGKKASELTAKFSNNYFLSGEINFKLTEEMTSGWVKTKILEKYSDGTVSFLDGISVFYETWKLNVRFSNTEPLLRLNIETIGRDFVTQKVEEVKQVLGLS